ncbi:5'-nucleotidase domain-containing protein 2 [Hondaea fermentalgiana]|uniref:5'-nucleotidase domain-containing protein 2 n=1 Tax=Hondaea fermentalgiana TaxID=2315210 RepID=A0A2R5GHK9_9STRA|nr:5'-nucleotidase domain-containing protein 2 [Hondaea fermentalgiana]|eukprot:GBG28133.1 5'-nucleotidase domain-containing protein 2 [Hondaea fermentalgiana]
MTLTSGLWRRLVRSGVQSASAGGGVTAETLMNMYSGLKDADFRRALDASGPPRQPGEPSSMYDESFSPREIFANSEIHMDEIQAIGFDYDFTLVSYKNALQELIFSKARDHLVKHKRYPEELRDHLEYDSSFAIRGLTFDTERGLLYKMDPSFRVDLTCVFRGRQRLDKAGALEALGGRLHMRRSAKTDSLRGIFDLFSLAEACLLSDVTDYFFNKNIEFSPAAVFQDVSSSISYVHRSGLMHRHVMEDMDTYLKPTPKLRTLLEELQGSGVQTFVLSNSNFDYVDAGMRFLCGDDWMQLFHVVACEAEKPAFYTSSNPFRQIDLDSTSSNDPLNRRRTNWSAVNKLEPGKAYCKGNVDDLMRMTQWEGSRVLYIGDHLFADLRTPARFHGWWTGAIIRELEHEIQVERSPEYEVLSLKMQLTEELMRRIQWSPPHDESTTSVSHYLDILDRERIALRQSMNDLVNPNFGSVFVSASHSPSLFSSFMTRYVDVYTSRLENLLDYGIPDYRFYPRKKRTLPHDPNFRSEAITRVLETALRRSVRKRDVTLRTELSFTYEDEDEKKT